MLAAPLRQTFMDFVHSIRNAFCSIPSVSQLSVQQDNVLIRMWMYNALCAFEISFLRVERELASEMKLQAISKGL